MKRIENITPPDKAAMERALERWNNVAKPLHSLGLLEEYIIGIAGITGNENVSLSRRCAVCMCADNGVVCEGVTQTDKSVTAIVARSMAEGTSNINLMAKRFDTDVIAVDIGIASEISCEGLVDRKIAFGTENIAEGPAMSEENAIRAIEVGIDMVRQCKEKQYNIIITGEMGIGNTTTTSAIASVLLDIPPERAAGRGAGLDDAGLRRKIAVIEKAIQKNCPDRSSPIDILSKLGGYDIAGMTGLFLGGAIYRIPVVIDGFISSAAACLAQMICPLSREYMLASHLSMEPAAVMLMDRLGFSPPITAGLHLGEGTGAVLLLPLLDAALALYDSSHSFDDLNMERYVDLC